MPCMEAQANKMARKPGEATSTITYLPAYTIDASYSDTVEGWIANSGNEDYTGPSLTYDLKSAQNTKWTDLGTTDFQTSVQGHYFFFTATMYVNGKMVTKNISAQEAGSELSVKMKTVGLASFGVKPGNW